MKAKHKRVIIGFATIAVLDLAGLFTMLADPDLTARVIPALGAVQIFGFIAIAAIFMMSGGQYISTAEADSMSGGRQWVPWLFGFLALLSFLRVLLALLYIAGDQGHRHSWFSTIAGTVMGAAFLWVAIKTRSLSRKH